MDEGLPDDDSPSSPPSPPPPEPEPDALDRALSSQPHRPDLPEHVKSLIGRMSKGKVYLVEESPGILHTEGKSRIRGDPRIAALVEMLDEQDPTDWLLAASEGASSPIRPNALFVRSEIIQHLSTAKVFSYATALGAGIMGIEWLNDTTLLLLFPSPSAALVGLALLCKAGFDPSEGDDPLLERAAHSIPVSLLPMAEPAPVASLAGAELIPDAPPPSMEEPRRRGRGTFGGLSFELEPLASETGHKAEYAPGVDPNARIAVRYAVEGDVELRTKARQSEWYTRHGRGAGKEVAATTRKVVGRRGPLEEVVSWEGRGGGEGKEFARRIGRERRTEPYSARGRRSGRDLDRELEGMARGRVSGDGMEVVEEGDGGGRRGGKRQGRGNDSRGREDLDRELDELFATRT